MKREQEKHKVVKLDKKEKYEHWLGIAQYDLDTAEVMFEASRYLYVAFMCQQAIEKLSKGLYVYNFDKEAKYTHNIIAVLDEIENIASLDEYEKHKLFFSELTSYYVSGRYEIYKQEVSQSLNKNNTQVLFDKTKGAFSWLKSQVKL